MQALKKLREVYGEDALLKASVSIGLLAFVLEISVCKTHRGGRILTTDDDKTKELIKSDQRITTREMPEKLNILK